MGNSQPCSSPVPHILTALAFYLLVRAIARAVRYNRYRSGTMKKNEKNESESLEIVCVIDQSGSMMEICNDAIEAFITFLREQRKERGDAKITVVFFNHNIVVPWDGVQLNQINEELYRKTYVPYGRTAMLDAIGKSILETDARLSSYARNGTALNPDVLLAIITDGYENASRVCNYEQIHDLIQSHIEKNGWDVIFLTSNERSKIMAMERLGIPAENIELFAFSSAGIKESYMKISEAANRKRKYKNVKGWKETTSRTGLDPRSNPLKLF